MKTLNTHIDKSFALFNGIPETKIQVPKLCVSRAVVGLLLLTQATKPEHGLTQAIVNLANMLRPLMESDKMNLAKYANLRDINSSVHNSDYDEQEYCTRVVGVCGPLEFIRAWYFEEDDEDSKCPFDLNEYSKNFSLIKNAAIEAFPNSIWSI